MRTILILTLLPLTLIVILLGTLLFSPDIEYQIGMAFLTGDGFTRNADWGIFWLERAAGNGQVEAQAVLGRVFLIGLPRQDLNKAVKYLNMGEQKDNNECLKLLAYAYAYGQGVPQDYTKTLQLTERSLKKELDGRELMNASFYSFILPPPNRSYEKAFSYSKQLMKVGYTSTWAYWCLASIHEGGMGVTPDNQVAGDWFQRAADLGDNDSQFALARMQLEGKLSRLKPQVAREYLRQAALTQVLDAQIVYATMLSVSKRDASQDKDFEQVLKMLAQRGFTQLAERLRHFSPKDIQTLSEVKDGTLHLIAAIVKRYGLCGPADLNSFKTNLSRACELNCADALTIQGNTSASTDIGDPNYDKAAQFYERASKQNHIYAGAQLGLLYALGLGVKHDWKTAVRLLTKSADAGEPEAQYMLGGFYCDGRGVEPDRNKAVALFEKAGLAGHQEALTEVGIICGSNEFPELQQDQKKAEKWLRKATATGFQEANYYLGSMLYERDSRAAALAFKEAADKGHLLCQLQIGRYYKGTNKYRTARDYFMRAKEQGSLTADMELQQLAIKEATFQNNDRLDSFVVAKTEIKSGEKITAQLVELKKLEITDDDTVRQDALVKIEPVLGTTAKEKIEKGAFVNESVLAVPDPTKKPQQ